MSLGLVNRGWIILIVCTAACGGTVDDGSASGPDGTADPSTSDTNGNPGANKVDGSFNSSQLPDCKVGFPVAQASDTNPCHFVGTDNKCYSTQDEACACVCPRDRPSLCVASGWGLDNDQDLVTCE